MSFVDGFGVGNEQALQAAREMIAGWADQQLIVMGMRQKVTMVQKCQPSGYPGFGTRAGFLSSSKRSQIRHGKNRWVLLPKVDSLAVADM